MPPYAQPSGQPIRQKVTQLMQSPRSAARKKGIITLSKKHNVPRQQAQFMQAVKIAQRLSRKSK